MKTILISPNCKRLRNGKVNPKHYPYWKELISLLHSTSRRCLQIALPDEPSIDGIDTVIRYSQLSALDKHIYDSDTFISIDSFLPHLCHYKKVYGIVIFGRSDPKIFGYTENVNILKDRIYLRHNQFDAWENTEYIKEAFVEPEVVLEAVNTVLNR